MSNCKRVIYFGATDISVPIRKIRKSIIPITFAIDDIRIYFGYVKLIEGNKRLIVNSKTPQCPILTESYLYSPQIFARWIGRYNYLPSEFSIINKVDTTCSTKSKILITEKKIISQYYTGKIEGIEEEYCITDIDFKNIHKYKPLVVSIAGEKYSGGESSGYSANYLYRYINYEYCYEIEDSGSIQYDTGNINISC